MSRYKIHLGYIKQNNIKKELYLFFYNNNSAKYIKFISKEDGTREIIQYRTITTYYCKLWVLKDRKNKKINSIGGHIKTNLTIDNILKTHYYRASNLDKFIVLEYLLTKGFFYGKINKILNNYEKRGYTSTQN